MDVFSVVKEFYKPLQPTVRAEDAEIIYQESKPNSEIDNFIYCFWQLKTVKPLQEEFVYRVVSDGCIDIFFNHHRPVENFIMGFCRKYTEFPLGTEFDYIGIRFLPSAFPLLFGVDAKKLSNQSQDLQLILPDFSEWMLNNIHPEHSFEEIVELFSPYLQTRIQRQTFYFDSRFFNSLRLIFQHKGCLDIETELNTGISARQLRRIFNFYIGTTPKAFSNVVRFQYLLNTKSSEQSLKESKLYFDAGFFDQAHFIKDFKNFYGITPSEAFR